MREDRMMNIREVARFLNVSTKTVYRLLDRGELTAVKVGARWRIHPDAVREYLEAVKK